MAKIIQFPKSARVPAPVIKEMPRPAAKTALVMQGIRFFARFLVGLVKGVSAIVFLVGCAIWPVLAWIISADLLFHFIRMIYFWNTPDTYAGWIFLLHLGVPIICMGYFIFIFNLKDL
jgi:hypothetical protein